jgi:hypothetical protein
MPLLVYEVPHRDTDVRSAVRQLIGEHLRIVFTADLTAPLTARLAESLRRIEESESRAPRFPDEHRDPAAEPDASKPE